MCGILCCYKCKCIENKRLLNRGPDHYSSISTDSDIHFSAYILHVQGEAKQPLSCNSQILLFNGQVFNYDQTSFASDTLALFDSLTNLGIYATIKNTHGPYAIIFYDGNKEELWFCRDYFGRRSLLISYNDNGCILCSVGDSTRTWHEVPSGGIFCLTRSESKAYPFQIKCLAYKDKVESCSEFASLLSLPISFTEDCLQIPISPFNMDLSLQTSLSWYDNIKKFLGLLSDSVRKRAQCCSKPLKYSMDIQIEYCKRHCLVSSDSDTPCSAHREDIRPSGARLGVLFSGGIDCTVIAALIHRFVPLSEPIDLLNVSFGNFDSTPDRLSALQSLSDLQQCCPGRQWNLIKINVTREELQRSRDQYITELLYPHNTVLDDSIGCALWFAARGMGYCSCGDAHSSTRVDANSPGQWMMSTARLLFSGIGADELMGGYSRHRGAWQNGGGLEGVAREIQLDIDRISERNLGRDNRVIGDHRRDCVAPYLDEDFVSFTNSLPIQYKVDFTRPRGEGEKIILRRVADSLGLKSCSILPKKAIQFGSRIAKLEGKKEKGNDVCERLTRKQNV